MSVSSKEDMRVQVGIRARGFVALPRFAAALLLLVGVAGAQVNDSSANKPTVVSAEPPKSVKPSSP